MSWVLDGVAGLEVVVVVCLVVVVVLAGLWLFTSELLVLCEPMLLAPDWLLVVSVLVLCASANVPVRSNPAARMDTFFMSISLFFW